MKFYNYRCSLCGQIISVSQPLCHGNPIMQVVDHDCENEIENGECTIWSFISVSDKPLKRASRVIQENNLIEETDKGEADNESNGNT